MTECRESEHERLAQIALGCAMVKLYWPLALATNVRAHIIVCIKVQVEKRRVSNKMIVFYQR